MPNSNLNFLGLFTVFGSFLVAFKRSIRMLPPGGLEVLRVEASFFLILATKSAFNSSTLRILILGPKNQNKV